MNTKASIAGIGVLVFLSLVVAVSAVDATVVKVDPASQTLTPGGSFSIDVIVEEVTYMAIDQATLNFDSSAMSVSSVTEGDFLKTAGPTLGAGMEIIDNDNGDVTFFYSLLAQHVGVDGSGTLATINFDTNASAEGTFDLELTNVLLGEGDGDKITVDVISSGTVGLDNTPPTVDIISPQTCTWFDSEDVVVTFHPWDNVDQELDYAISVDGEEKASGTAPNCTETEVNLGVLEECDHIIRVNVMDDVGLEGSAEVTIHVDLTPPTVEIMSPANGTWFDSEPFNITFHPWDNKAELLNYSIFDDGVEVANGTAENCTTTNVTLNPEILGDCDHVIRVNVTDYAGKTNSSEVTIHIDLTPPTVEIMSPANGTWFDSEPFNITFHSWDNKAQLLNYSVFDDGVEVANGIVENCTTTNVTLNPEILGDCDHVIRVNVTDMVGKTNSSEVTIHVDLTPPTVEIISPANDTWFDNEPVNVTFRPWDNKAQFLNYSVFLDGVEVENGTIANYTEKEVNLGVLEECDHVIRINVTDMVGKINSSAVTIHVDLTPPTVELVSPANGTWFGLEDVQVTFHPWDNKADMLEYRIYVDDEEKANGTAANNSDKEVNIGGTITTVGAHTIRVEVTDYAGKTNSSAVITIYVDPILPTIEILSPEGGEWFTSEPVNVTFHLWDNLAQQLNYSIYIDDQLNQTGIAQNDSTTEIDLGILPECNHEIRVNVTDKVGNMNSSAVTIHVDRTPPTVKIISPENNTWLDSGDVVITFHPWDNKAQHLNYSVFLDGLEVDNGTIANDTEKEVNLGVLEECDHVISVNVTDMVGKTNFSEVTVHVDLTPPTVEILSPANGTWFDSEPFNITFHTWDNKAQLLNYSIFDDGVEVANGTAENCTITNVTLYPVELGDCNHTIRVNVTDYAGKTNFSEVTIHIDLTPPTVEITSPTNGTWFDSEPVNVTFHPWDNKAQHLNYSVFLDGLEVDNGTIANDTEKEVNLGVLEECDHVISVNVTDMVGKTNFSEVTVHVDLTPPTVEILSPANGTWFDSEPFNITFHTWDNKAQLLNYSIFDDGVEVANGTAENCTITNVTLNPEILGDCDHVIRVNVTDYAGKTNFSEVMIHVDLTPPTVEILSPANGTWFDSEPFNITFHSWDNKAQLLNYSVFDDGVEVANGIVENCTTTNVTLNPEILGDCDHVIRVNVTDMVGKTNSSEVTIHVDLTPPTVEIISPANDTWFDNEPVNVTFRPWDNKAQFLNYSVFLDGVEVENGTIANYTEKEVNLGVLEECDHVIRVNATDKVGKTNSSEVTIHVDLTPPTVDIISPEEGMIYGTACIRLNFTAKDIGECPSGINEIYYVLDGGDPVTIPGNATISDIGPCEHTVVVYVKDKAGKENHSSEVSFTLYPGDITGDGKVNLLDLQRLGWALGSDPSSPNWNEAADLNCDNSVNVFDLQILAWNYMNDYTVIC